MRRTLVLSAGTLLLCLVLLTSHSSGVNAKKSAHRSTSSSIESLPIPLGELSDSSLPLAAKLNLHGRSNNNNDSRDDDDDDDDDDNKHEQNDRKVAQQDENALDEKRTMEKLMALVRKMVDAKQRDGKQSSAAWSNLSGAAASLPSAIEPLVDRPYTQPISHRYTYSSVGEIATWPVLNLDTPLQVASFDNGTYILCSDSIWIYSNSEFNRVNLRNGVTIPSGAQILPSRSGNAFLLIAQHQILTCPVVGYVAECQSSQTLLPPIVGLSSLYLSDDGLFPVYIATSEALFYLGSSQTSNNDIRVVLSFPDDPCTGTATNWNVRRNSLSASAASSSSASFLASSSSSSFAFELSSYNPSSGWYVVSSTGTKLWITPLDGSGAPPQSDDLTSSRFFRVPGIIDASPSALAYSSDGSLFIGNSICLNVMHANMTFDRVSGLYGGLPMPNITSISALPNSDVVWFGTKFGSIRLEPSASEDLRWKYFYGPRWIPGSSITDGQVVSFVAAFRDQDSVEVGLVAGDRGLAAIRMESWTLKQKADHYQSLIYPRHDRFGLVADCNLAIYGNLSSYQQHSTDNDGLWTSIYVVSQAFRYAVTKDPQAKADAWHSFEGMEFLNNVTGIAGLMARSVLNQTATPSSGTWHNSTVYPGWIWKGDTSSDEVTGHMFAHPIVYDLVAETTDEKQRAMRLLKNIVTYIVENNYYLIDVTGKHTTWGIWNPDYLNDNPDWYDERGPNSMQILSWLLTAYNKTGEQLFMDSYRQLTEQHGYAINIVNQKITQPSDDNFSDDELAHLPYFTYLWSERRDLDAAFARSINRARKILRGEKSSLWNMIYAVALSRLGADAQGGMEVDPNLLEDAAWTLRTWPTEQIQWPVSNLARQDQLRSPYLTRSNTAQSLRLFPYDENSMYRWNGNPYEYGSGSGQTEYDPSAWLLPYWMGRYYGFIVDAK